jgi:BirA family transcriptional regulator, biotin operon repressor / biotin---[acetyl-CoA-carboxylase] ligase
MADIQTKGRGRGRNRWDSPKGGLWFSILLRPKTPTSKLPLLQFLAAVATRRALERETGLSVRLKWPNDLVVGKSKLGGILLESKTQGDSVAFVILGIGLNINQPKDRLPPGATSLRLIAGERYDLLLLLRTILDEIRSSFHNLDASKVMKEWWRNCMHRPLRVQVAVSKDTLTGISRGIEDDGSLLIETDDHRIWKVSEGSLTLLKD